jgi:hypothetical protein
MRESRTSGSVRGDRGNPVPYRYKSLTRSDLLHRAELGTERRHERRHSWWLDHYASGLAQEYVKSHGRTVKDIMTRDVVTVTEDTNLADVATLLEIHRIKRVPVMCDGKIVGIVSRSNLVRALGATLGTSASSPGAGDDDRAIRTRLIAELSQQPWAGKVWAQAIIVSNGVAHLWFGSDETEERRQAARVAAENVPGVRGVEEHEVPVPLMPAF